MFVFSLFLIDVKYCSDHSQDGALNIQYNLISLSAISTLDNYFLTVFLVLVYYYKVTTLREVTLVVRVVPFSHYKSYFTSRHIR